MFSLYFLCWVSLIYILTVNCRTVEENSNFTITSGNQGSNGYVLSRIVGGEYAEPGEYPFYVSLQRKRDRFHYCGGCLISDQYVLTAASCYWLPLVDLVIVVGLNSLPGNNVYEADKFIQHPNFKSDIRSNDIALIRLKKRVTLSENVSIIELPHPKPDYLTKYGYALRLSGYGFEEEKGRNRGRNSPRLKKLTVSVNHCPKELYLAGRICASTIKDISGTCHGDLGSPAIIYADLTIVMGIVSQHSVIGKCATGKPDLLTDVQYYEEWVRSQLFNITKC